MFSDLARNFCKLSQGVAIGYSHDLPPRSFMATLGRFRGAVKSVNNVAASETPEKL